jgi:hypothetical protein
MATATRPAQGAMAVVAGCAARAAHGRDHDHAFSDQGCHPHAVQVVYMGHRAMTLCHDCRVDSGFLPCHEAERLAVEHRDQTREAGTFLALAAGDPFGSPG